MDEIRTNYNKTYNYNQSHIISLKEKINNLNKEKCSNDL